MIDSAAHTRELRERGYFRSIVALRRVKDLQEFINDLDGVDATLSILDYLEVLDKTREHYNTWLVPYWNVLGFTAWARSNQRLERADTALGAATTPDARAKATTEFDTATNAYLNLPVGDRVLAADLAASGRRGDRPVIAQREVDLLTER